MSDARPKVAVIGSGVSGLAAAYALHRSHDVVLLEADDRPGGHAHTHELELHGHPLRVDSGFIVCNDRTYPTLLRIFAELGVATQETDMSMSVFHEADRFQYSGGQGARGIFADPGTVRRPDFWRMLRDVRRFHRAAKAHLASTSSAASDEPLEQWLAGGGYSEAFTTYFMRPLVAAVWSCDPQRALDYPARSLLTFLEHHGMLTVTGSPTWRTVVGGSRSYVEKITALVELRLSTPVAAVTRREGGGVRITDAAGDAFDADHAIIATHPREALAMRPDASAAEREVLGAIDYSRNPALLHTDASVLPPATRARGSWNYLLPAGGGDGVTVTYDLTRLMRLPSPRGERMLVTLGGEDRVDPQRVLRSMTYEHPLYTMGSLRAQQRLGELSDTTLAYAGAYHGWGFHEDGALSGVTAAKAIGGSW